VDSLRRRRDRVRFFRRLHSHSPGLSEGCFVDRRTKSHNAMTSHASSGRRGRGQKASGHCPSGRRGRRRALPVRNEFSPPAGDGQEKEASAQWALLLSSLWSHDDALRASEEKPSHAENETDDESLTTFVCDQGWTQTDAPFPTSLRLMGGLHSRVGEGEMPQLFQLPLLPLPSARPFPRTHSKRSVSLWTEGGSDPAGKAPNCQSQRRAWLFSFFGKECSASP